MLVAVGKQIWLFLLLFLRSGTPLLCQKLIVGDDNWTVLAGTLFLPFVAADSHAGSKQQFRVLHRLAGRALRFEIGTRSHCHWHSE